MNTLEPSIRQQFPDTFGGLWIDKAEGEVTSISLAFSANAESNVAILKESFPYPALLVPISVESSYAALEDLQISMVEDRSSAHENRLEIPGLANGNYDIDLDVQSNAIVVTAPEFTESTRSWFADRYGQKVSLAQDTLAVPSVCNNRGDCTPLRASLAITTPNDTLCSSGFSVTRNGNSNKVVMSAGHCAGSGLGGAVRYHDGVDFGSVQDHEYMDNVDASIISVENPFANPVAKIYATDVVNDYEVNDSSTWSALPLGEDACMAGAEHAENCGEILGKSFSPNYMPGTPTRMIKVDYCSSEGDSGGAAYRKQSVHRAVGIQSGTHDGGVTCHHSSGDYWSVFGHIEYALDAMDVSLNTL